MPKVDVPTRKKPYRKPELRTLTPQAAIEKLKPLAASGDRSAQRMIQAISDQQTQKQ